MGGVVTRIENPGLSPEQWQAAVNDMLDFVQSVTPVKTGRLQAGWRVNTSGDAATFYNDTPYAEYVNDGTPRMDAHEMTTQLEDEASSIIGNYEGMPDEEMDQADYRAMRQGQLRYK